VKLPFSWRHKDRHPAPPAPRPEPASAAETHVVQIDADQLRELSAVFAAPRWLRDLGIAAWLLFGVAGLLVGLVWLLTVTASITIPVILGLILATVAAPVVSWLHRHGVHRAVGALLVLLGFIALFVVIVLLVVGGIVAQGDTIEAHAREAADKAEAWLKDAGVDSSGAASANAKVTKGVGESISTFAGGLANIVQGVTSLVFFLVFTVFSLFFLLKDGPTTRAWVDRHLGVPQRVAQTITGDIISSLRRYFGGVTIVAAFNAVVVGLGALVLGVPLAGTIAVVTFVTAYIPFIGAFVAGAFAVILALGSGGTSDALIMLVIVLLANGMLQNIVQPIAFGATLGLNPLIVLIATIGAGSLFGMLGLVLGAPLTSAAVHITADLAQARAEAKADEDLGGPAEAGEPSTVPG
jgi:predicted PurR-regulated permease PerM